MLDLKNKPRVLCCGDIHGNVKGLEQVIERCGYNKEHDMLIFLGDYVDGYPESAQVIDFLITLNSQAIYKPIFIRGNHDIWAGEWLKYNQKPNIWVQNGGESTINSYLDLGLVGDIEHTNFFTKLHDYYIDDNNNGFVHGGFSSKKGLGHEPDRSIYVWDRDLWSKALLYHSTNYKNSKLNYNIPFKNHNEIFIGHTTTMNWRCKNHYPEAKYIKIGKEITIPMNRYNVWNLDTGGGYNGKISIMDINTKQYWQSDLSNVLYPNFKFK